MTRNCFNSKVLMTGFKLQTSSNSSATAAARGSH